MEQHHENVVSNIDIGIRFYESIVDNDGYVPFHWHSSIELICVLEGTLILKFEGRKHIIQQNEFVVVSSGVVHDVTNTSNHALVLQIPIKFMENYFPNADRLHFYTDQQKRKPEYQIIINRLIALNRINQKGDEGYLFDMGMILLNVLKSLILNFTDEKSPVESKMSGLKEILIYINSHYNEKIRVAELAQHYGYNASYLSRLFKEQTGITLIEYIYEVRLSNLYGDLIDTEIPIGQLFEKHGLFNRRTTREMCKKIFGRLPRKIREESRK